MIDLKTAEKLVRRYLAPIVVVILISLGVGAYFVSEYKDLSKQKDVLADKQKIFNEQRVEYERGKIASERELLGKKAEISRLEDALKKKLDEYDEKLALVQKRTSQNDIAENDLRRQAALVGENQLLKEGEEKLQKAISNFSDMKVDLSSAPPCDADALQRYNAAKVKYSEVLTLASAYKLYNRYQSFFLNNRPSGIVMACNK